MNKSKIYSSILAVITAVVLWDMADYFILDLGFPRDLLDRCALALPAVMMILIGLLMDRESKKAKVAEQDEADG
jgi:hypothetical protein